MEPNSPLDRFEREATANKAANYRKDGRERKPFGKWLRRSAPVAGKFLKGVALGVIDGIPGVSQVASTVSAGRKVNNFDPVVRVTVGWATVVMVGMAFALRLSGHLDNLSMLQVLRILCGF